MKEEFKGDDIEKQLVERVAMLNAVTPEEWVAMLQSDNPNDRATAALHLLVTGQTAEEELVIRMLESEQDLHVQMMISGLIAGRDHDRSHVRFLTCNDTNERV